MGRSAGGSGGGSSGGGGRSSGGSHRSSGGHSHSSSSRSARSNYSGGSSHYSSSGRSSRRSYNNSYNSYGSNYGSGNRYVRNTFYGTRYGSPYRQVPFMTVLIQFVALMILVFVVGAVVMFRTTPQIPNSTIEREALDKSKVVVTKYYDDRLGWLTSGKKVENGIKYFFDKTGVQPYLVIADNIDGSVNPSPSQTDKYLDDLYNQMFKDEQHMIVLYFDNGSSWFTRYYCGVSAGVVMDSEACEIVLSYLDYYATSDMEDDDYFNTVFRKSADKIMTVSTNKYDVMRVVVLSVCLIVAAVLLVVARKIKLKSLKKQQELLDTNLVDPLLSKYEEDKKDG